MVSLDDPEKNRAFGESLDGNFPILSDPGKEVAEAYGVLGLGGLYSRRWTFYIDPTGRIRDIDKDVDPKTAGQDVAKRLEALGFPTVERSEANDANGPEVDPEVGRSAEE